MKLVSGKKSGSRSDVKVFPPAASSNLIGYEKINFPLENNSFTPLETQHHRPGKGC